MKVHIQDGTPKGQDIDFPEGTIHFTIQRLPSIKVSHLDNFSQTKPERLMSRQWIVRKLTDGTFVGVPS